MSDTKQSKRAHEMPPRIPSGEYDAQCIGSEIANGHNANRKAYLWFDILYEGAELFMAMNYPKGKKSFGLKAVQEWMIAQGRRRKKGERITLKSFHNTMFKVRVRDVTGVLSNGNKRPEHMKYSVVDGIIKPLTGDKFPSPPRKH